MKRLPLFPFLVLCGVMLTPTWQPAELQSALDLSVRFYGTERCGDLHNPLLAHNPAGHRCHMGDGQPVGQDFTGGWHDAGDFIKWSRTTAWSAYLLLKAMDAFPGAFGDRDSWDYRRRPNGIPDLLDEAKIGTDFLLKILTPDGKLLSRVGGNQDHNFLFTSPAQSAAPVAQGGDPRPLYFDARADVAGISAAALALMAKLYAPYDTAYSRQCLTQARKLYTYGKAHPGTTPDNFYPEGDCNGNSWDANNWDGPKCKGKWTDGQSADAMMCGAVELYRNAVPDLSKSEVQTWMDQNGSHYDDPSWMQMSDPCWHSLAVSGFDGAVGYWRPTVQNYLSHISQDSLVRGLVYFHPWGSLRIASHAGFSMALYSTVQTDPQIAAAARAQLDFILGKNPYDRSFLTGWGKNPPRNPMHKNAWGLNGDWSLLDHFEPKFPIVGALVGGPKDQETSGFPAGYQDNPRDYVGNEVTIYYNAGLVGLLAWQLTSK